VRATVFAGLYEDTFSMTNLRDMLTTARANAIVRIREMGMVGPTAGVSRRR
jgi:hypothetical protein